MLRPHLRHIPILPPALAFPGLGGSAAHRRSRRDHPRRGSSTRDASLPAIRLLQERCILRRIELIEADLLDGRGPEELLPCLGRDGGDVGGEEGALAAALEAVRGGGEVVDGEEGRWGEVGVEEVVGGGVGEGGEVIDVELDLGGVHFDIDVVFGGGGVGGGEGGEEEEGE